MAHVKEYVHLAEPSNNWLKREQAGWFFDRDTPQIRSLHDDRCLHAYQPTNGGGAVHLWKCLPNENNQKWEYDAATGKLRHAHNHNFYLDNDPDQNNNLQLWECSWGNANQEWDLVKPGAAGNSTGLVLRTKKSFAQLWMFDSASGQIRAKDSDFCIDAYEPSNGGTLWSCHDMNQDANAWWKNNQAWRTAPASARVFKIMNDDRSVVEYVDKTNLVGRAASKSDTQLWRFNAAKKSIISKWNDECLDGYEANENGAKRFHNASNADYCLAYGGGKKLVVKRCNLNEPSQTVGFGSVE
ncbi:hypothetical protein ATCC90586_010940 [Pythium insidiosum]|nr:hypothetical protein ATCC90586_010940 [Pythium insidiosum]